jgi:hypothetical protein
MNLLQSSRLLPVWKKFIQSTPTHTNHIVIIKWRKLYEKNIQRKILALVQKEREREGGRKIRTEVERGRKEKEVERE